MSALLLLALLLEPPARALSPGDAVTVHFKDGTCMTGLLSEVSGGRIALHLGGGISIWDMASVARIDDASVRRPRAETPAPAPEAYAAPGPSTYPPRPYPQPSLSSPPPMGFVNAQPAYPAYYAGYPTYVAVAVPVAHAPAPDGYEALLRGQAAEREARRHQVTTPESDFQFNLQQFIDRGAPRLPGR